MRCFTELSDTTLLLAWSMRSKECWSHVQTTNRTHALSWLSHFASLRCLSARFLGCLSACLLVCQSVCLLARSCGSRPFSCR